MSGTEDDVKIGEGEDQRTISMDGADLAKDVCAGFTSWTKRWGSDKAVMEELEGRPVWCLDQTFMYTLLRLGYGFGEDRQAKLGKKIDGTELGWCLGATLAMIGADLTCRA